MQSFFIDFDGYLFGCGSNLYGQLGIDTYEVRHLNTFKQISDHKFKSVSASEDHTMAIDEDGNLWACGQNCTGQLGLGDRLDRNKFKKVPTDGKFRMVSCGSWHTMAIDVDGNLWACGYNKCGKLGLGDNDNRNILDEFRQMKDLKWSAVGVIIQWRSMKMDIYGLVVLTMRDY